MRLLRPRRFDIPFTARKFSGGKIVDGLDLVLVEEFGTLSTVAAMRSGEGAACCKQTKIKPVANATRVRDFSSSVNLAFIS